MPLRSYRGERLIVILIASAALAVVTAPAAAIGRVALADAFLDGRVTIDAYAGETIDRARYEGHYYSDKAPGLSAVAAIPVGVLSADDPTLVEPRSGRLWNSEGSFSLWVIQALVGGLFFVLGVVLVGRVAEGVAARTGAVAAVAYGLGTLAHPLAPTLFGHIPAGTLGLAGLLLAARGTRLHLLAAGACAGAAVLIEYQAALIVLALLIYAAWRSGPRAAAVLAVGGLPAAALLGLYNVAAFGSPLRLSYTYVDNVYAERQSEGFFGIGLPDPSALWTILVGDRGLLLSPVLAVAAGGLWLLAREGFRREAAIAAGVAVAFLVVNLGYFLPYGGVSPGPRIFATCIPLLALGFGPAFARWPRTTYAATAVSVLAMTSASLTWSFAMEDGFLIPSQDTLSKTIWMALAGDRIDGAVLTGALAFAAFAVAAYLQLASGASGTLRRPASWRPSP